MVLRLPNNSVVLDGSQSKDDKVFLLKVPQGLYSFCEKFYHKKI